MRVLTPDDFSGKTGASYEVAVDGGSVPLVLKEFQPLPSAGREGGSFRLVFVGPAEPVLPQAIYPFRSDDEVVDIFIVPIGREQGGTEYEAIFF
jgi:hypothetical protein